ncbi:MAG: hypothetical protein ACRDH8_03590 [Actinomycetota bacterium]
MRPIRVALLLGVTAAGLLAAPAAPAGPARLATPDLIERAVERGSIDRETGALYLAYALLDHERLPAGYRSEVPWDGTLPLLQLRRDARTMNPGPERREIRQLMAGDSEAHPIGDVCGDSTDVKTHTIESAHFYIEYDQAPVDGGSDGLSISSYTASLDAAWNTEVGAFGWAAPPMSVSPPPNNKYPVRLEDLAPGLYGYVTAIGTHAGFVGNNPNTPWDEGDAYASCMVLREDYSGFPSPPQPSLEATVAHEFNHSIQFGYGALSGSNVPDFGFVEGITTWVEDEVFDGSNDNYNYLWPDFADDMGQYEGKPYATWVVFRAIAERFGTTLPAGSEQLYQRFWESVSQNQGSQLDALGLALGPAGLDLPTAYHDAAVALKFNRGCGGGYVYPYCLEEGPDYVALRGPTPVHGRVPGIGAKAVGSLPDNYSLNWITLPPGTGPFQAVLKNTSNGGLFRGSVACDTGGQIVNVPLSGDAGGGKTVTLQSFDPAACQTLVAVITNITQSGGNPTSSPARSYEFMLTPTPNPSSLTLKVKRDDEDVIAKGKLKPKHNGQRIEVTLFKKKKGKGFRQVKAEHPQLKRGRYETDFNRPKARRCRITASFPGDLDHRGSEKTKTFRC